MPNQATNQRDHDDVFALLPWYVNRTLESEQTDLVSQHIDHCSECQQEVQFLKLLNNGIADDVSDQYRTHADVEGSLSGVLDRIACEQDNQPSLNSWISRLKASLHERLWHSFNMPASNMPASQWAATAMVGALVVGLGGVMYVNSSNDDYTVLSSPVTNPLSLRLVVNVEAPEYEEPAQAIIGAEFEKIDKNVTIEKDPDGAYTVTIDDVISVDEVNDVIKSLESNGEISKVNLSP